MGSLSVPVIDISDLIKPEGKEKSFVLRKIGDACEQWGFFYVVNHGVNLALVEKAQKLGKEFFNMPKSFKDKVARKEDNFQGFSDSELTKQKVDWKQVFDFTPEVPDSGNLLESSLGVHGKNQWPDIPQFQETMEVYLKDMQKLSRNLFCAILQSLGVDPSFNVEEFVKSKCFPGEEETSVCRLNFYPKCPNPTIHLGVGPHTDPAVVTVLLQDDDVSSLQVQRDGKFYDIPPVKDSFVINIGDMMQVWSNGRYKAPTHRVLANHNSDRFSLPFFLAPAYSCIVKPLPGTFIEEKSRKYDPIHWGHFRMERYKGDYADKGEEIQISHYEVKNIS